MNGENQPERRAINGMALRWSHLILALVIYLLTIGVIYGTMRTQIEELRRSQTQSISNPQFQEFKEDIERRLTRIEGDLDDIKRAALKKEVQELQPASQSH